MDSIMVKYELETKYIINSMVGKFSNLFKRAMELNLPVDLSDCKLGPDCASELRKYYGKVKIINSTDEVLNKILNDNTEAALITSYAPYPEMVFPTRITIETLMQYIQDTKDGAQLHPTVMTGESKKLAFLTLFIMIRPDVDVDIHDCAIALYDYISSDWELCRVSHDKYIQFMRPDWCIIECNNGIMGTPYTGYMSEDLYISKYDVLPYDFGTKMLLEEDEAGRPSGEWRNVINKCMNELCKSSSANATHLYDYLKVRSN